MTPIPIIAGVATIPSREATFREMLASVAPQVDRVHVYLSGHVAYLKGLPESCHQYMLPGDPFGDAGKFLVLDDAYDCGGYYLTFDDDLLYPPDYVETLVKGIEFYRRKFVCSFHGRNFGRYPISNYYRNARRRLYCLHEVFGDEVVHVPGTGCMGFHTSTLKLGMGDFPTRNMADVHLAVALRRQGAKAVCLKHATGWIKQLDIDHGKSLYNLHKDDCAEQTRRINEAFS